jgi:phosphoribosyl 1,2-cyclic phosphate phosphodiesterase
MAGVGRLQVRILGCGSSGGVPRIGNDWGACDPSDPRNRRSRCSILVRHWGPGAAEPTLVLIDTSPDMRDQLLAARVDRLDAVVLSHEHADQCHGIDDLRALVIRHRRRLPVHMNPATADAVLRRGMPWSWARGRISTSPPGPPIRTACPSFRSTRPSRMAG